MNKNEYLSRLEKATKENKIEVRCFECGKVIEEIYQSPRKRCYCNECKEKVENQYKADVENHVFYKTKIMHEHAIRLIENTCRYDINKIKESIDFVREMELASPESFLSSYEIITAIVLIEESYLFKINHKVGKYKVDFFMPEEKVCLEVDGGYHEHSLAKDGKRDIELRDMLGKEWEVIRIPTRWIEKNPAKIPEYIEGVYKKIKEARKKNNGLLPKNFSKTTKAYYEELGLCEEKQ